MVRLLVLDFFPFQKKQVPAVFASYSISTFSHNGYHATLDLLLFPKFDPWSIRAEKIIQRSYMTSIFGQILNSLAMRGMGKVTVNFL